MSEAHDTHLVKFFYSRYNGKQGLVERKKLASS